MERSAEEKIDTLKRMLNAKSDAELARKLGIDKRTVSSWKIRGKIPERFELMIEGKAGSHAYGTAPAYWSGIENIAMSLAAIRYSEVVSEASSSKDFESILSMAFHPEDIWTLHREAYSDLCEVMKAGSHSFESAVAVLIHRELDEPIAAKEARKKMILDNRPSVEWSDGEMTDPAGRPLRKSL